MTDSFKRISQPEIVFGFVCPIGASLTATLNAFREYFERKNYKVVEIKITDIFQILPEYLKPTQPLDHSSVHERYKSYIAYGNQIREQFGDAALASVAIRRIMHKRIQINKRREQHENNPQQFEKIVYLVHQFKRKEEIDLLRSIYGRLFFQISIYSRRGARVVYLSRKFAEGVSSNFNNLRSMAEAIVQQDENEVGRVHGQRVASIFHDADFIVNLDVSVNAKDQIHRFCELLFGANHISPSRREYGLFLAKAAALRSLDLSRQVGAAIFSSEGEIVSLGSNEVPKATGGTYWSEESFDQRDYVLNIDTNFSRKREILSEIVKIVAPESNIDDLMKQNDIKKSQLMNALEYGRMLHAEMCALSDAARIGRPVKGGTLYCTTFPCHMCAKHIVAAGIECVVFLEPYPKSLASDLHADSISVEGNDRGAHQRFPSVTFEHFFGVSPRRYRELFERGSRKHEETGVFKQYQVDPPTPIVDIKFPFYSELEGYLTESAVVAFTKFLDFERLAKLD